MKRTLVGATAVLSLVLACGGQRGPGYMVESPDAWTETTAAQMNAVGPGATAVLGFESQPVQSEPAPSPEWEVTEGHVTIVGTAP